MRRAVALGAAALAAAAAAGLAGADGDPASDVLPTDTVYFPVAAPSRDARSALAGAVAAVYAHGDRIRVAVIATRDDLGAIPSLMNRPGDYARFLGQELAAFYVGPLLIAMPKGFGVYDGGRSVAAASRVLAGVDSGGASVDGLVRSTATAVRKLEAAGALSSPDVRAPYVYPEPAAIRPGKTAALRFRLLDDSNRARVAITVLAGSKQLASLRAPLAATDYPVAHTVRWPVPGTIPARGVRVCMVAADAAGNRSARACAALRVVR